MKIDASDFMIGLDVVGERKTVKLEDVEKQLDYLIVEGINVGILYKNMKAQSEHFMNFQSPLFIPMLPDTTPNQGFTDDSVEKLFTLLNKCKSISSSNEKESVIIEMTNVFGEQFKKFFLRVINLTYSTFYTYNITKKILEGFLKDQPSVVCISTVDLAIETLEKIGLSKDMSPTECKNKIKDIYLNSSLELRQLIDLIIARDLNIKVSEKTFWNIFGHEHIKLVPYQRCETMDKIHKLNYPCISQLKADGKFSNVIFDLNPEVYGFSLNRSGKDSYLTHILNELHYFNYETKYFDNVWKCPVVFHGEAVIKDTEDDITGKSSIDFKVLERQTGNGYLNSYGKRFFTFQSLVQKITDASLGTINKKVQDLCQQLLEWYTVEKNMILQVWNLVPFETWKKLNTTFTVSTSYDYLVDFIKHYNNWCKSKNKQPVICLIHTEFSASEEEVLDKYKKWLKLGYEGQIAKNLNCLIEHGTCSTGIVKLKDFKECDLRVVGFIPGEGQFTGGIGSLLSTSECGQLNVKVSGLSMSQRGFERVDETNSALGIKLKIGWDNEIYNGKIINVKYNMLSKDKNGNYSLSLPCISDFRDDVPVAQTLEDIKKKKN